MTENGSRSTSRFSGAEKAVLAFTGLYLSVALVASLRLGNEEFLLYFGVLCALIGAVAQLHRRIGLSLGALWALSVWGLAHMAGGLLPVPEAWPIKGETSVLYNWWLLPGLLKFDHVVHAYGFGIVTWVCWQGLRGALRTRDVPATPSFGLLSLCVAAGMGFGAANEVVEFLATIMLPGTNVGGYENTGWDLVANLVGSVTAAGVISGASR